MPTTLILQSFSKNNYAVYARTVGNHIEYCKRHQYSLLLNNEPYSMWTDFGKVGDHLKHYDRMMTCGSDVVFTDYDRPIDEFDLNFINISQEQHKSPRAPDESYSNAEMVLFSRTHGDIIPILEEFGNLQGDYRQNPASFKDGGMHPYNYSAWWGTQSLYNVIHYLKLPIGRYINYIECGRLQSLLPVHNPDVDLISSIWKVGSFAYHCPGFGNEAKCRTLDWFRAQHPEFFP